MLIYSVPLISLAGQRCYSNVELCCCYADMLSGAFATYIGAVAILTVTAAMLIGTVAVLSVEASQSPNLTSLAPQKQC